MAAESSALAWLLFLLAYALSLLWLGPVINAVQTSSSRSVRSTASACFLLINNLIGLGFGDLHLRLSPSCSGAAYGAEALRYAIR